MENHLCFLESILYLFFISILVIDIEHFRMTLRLAY